MKQKQVLTGARRRKTRVNQVTSGSGFSPDWLKKKPLNGNHGFTRSRVINSDQPERGCFPFNGQSEAKPHKPRFGTGIFSCFFQQLLVFALNTDSTDLKPFLSTLLR